MADTGYTEKDMQQWQQEGSEYTRIAQESPEQAKMREQFQQRTQAPEEMAKMQAAIAQEKMARQQLRAAYAQGYNPAATTQAFNERAEQEGELQSQVQRLAAEDKDRAMQAYGKVLQQRQQMALAAEQAKRAYVMGNQELALRHLDAARRAELAEKGVAMQEAVAKMQATDRMVTAGIQAASTLGAMYATRQPAPAVKPVSGQPPIQAGAPKIQTNYA